MHLILDNFCLFSVIGFQPSMPGPGVIIRVFRVYIYNVTLNDNC